MVTRVDYPSFSISKNQAVGTITSYECTSTPLSMRNILLSSNLVVLAVGGRFEGDKFLIFQYLLFLVIYGTN